MIRILPVILAILIPHVAAGGQIYKCTDENGRSVFSQTPCGDQAETMDVEPQAPIGGSLAPQDTNLSSRADRVSKQRMLKIKISNSKRRISALQDERDEKVTGYRREMMRSAYNEAGVARNQQYQALIDQTNERYSSEIRQEQSRLSSMERELASLGQ